MAPTKRLRSSQNEDEVNDSDVESTLSNPRRDSRKKARVSGESPDSDDSQALTDEDVLEQQATQFITQQRSKKQLDNEPADNGILESVTCTNFMCHGYLEVTLGPLINFIIGHNGSGKSAVLTAITICLGGKATATNRGQSLKSFIKEGQESCVLSVKIKNTASSAYQHEVYGDSIIVERSFSRTGSSGFKLKTSAGRLISTRKSDLEEICDYFALQIDNPMNVLTQDMARQFLNNSSPVEKYKFFMKGTQLEHLDGDYLQIEQSIDKIDQDLFKQVNDLKAFEEEARKARSLLALSEKQDSLRAKIENYSHQMAWAQVEEQEGYVASYDTDLRKAQVVIGRAEAKAAEAADVFTSADEAHENASSAVENVKAERAPMLEKKDNAKVEFDKLKADVMGLRAEQRQIKDHMKAAEGRITKAKTDIEAEKRRLDDVNGGSHLRRIAEIEEKRAGVVDARSKLGDHERRIGALEEDRRQAEIDLEELQRPLKDKRTEVQQCEQQLDALIKDRGQRQGAYNANMPRLLSAIRQDDGFQQQPVGPIGSHARLLKPLWSSVLEKSFGGALNSFVVTSKQDQNRLLGLMQRLGCICPILIGNNALIDTTNHEPYPEFDTSLRVLEIDNDLVRNQLIINQAIEQTILIENRGEAIAKMKASRLPNVKQCFTQNVKPGAGLRLNYGYGGALAQGYIDPFTSVPRMKTDVEYQITAQREALRSLKAELNDIEQNRRDRQNHLTRCNQAIVAHNRQQKELVIVLQRAESIVENLQDALDRDAIEESRLDALKDHLREAEEEKSTYEGSYEESINAIDKATDAMKISREQMSEMDAQIAEAEAKVLKAESKATKLENQRLAALQAKNKALQTIEDEKRRMQVKEREREEKIETVRSFTEQANVISPRVPVDAGETGESIDNKLKKLVADLKKYEDRIGGSKQQIAENATAAVTAFQQAKSQVNDVEQLAQMLKQTLVNRKERWKYFQKAITARARLQFLYLLSERSFRGRLLANHKEKKLDLHVEPDETTQRGQGRETKTLSGGEKSFSTICLLLSLWDAMGAPIRCLDEFDVFMDSVNRDVSMRLMVNAARKSVGKQFILITPQSMGNVDSGPDVKIIKMRDPERGQTTISFPGT